MNRPTRRYASDSTWWAATVNARAEALWDSEPPRLRAGRDRPFDGWRYGDVRPEGPVRYADEAPWGHDGSTVAGNRDLAQTAAKNLVMVRVGAEVKYFDTEGGAFHLDDPAVGAGEHFHLRLRIDAKRHAR